MNYNTLHIELENKICIITINRPDKLNALNGQVMEELNQAILRVYEDPAIKSAILTGSGNRAFVAGADIGEFKELNAEQGVALAKKGQKRFFQIENCPKPIVAAVNGYALGGGCELALACHLRVASDNAMFGQPEVNLGLLPGYGGTQRLTRLIGKGRALEMMITAGMIDAVTAFNYGLVNHVVAPEQLLPRAKSVLEVINSKAPLAVAACIKASGLAAEGKNEGYEFEAQSFGELIASEDTKEGINAFLEKRKATFKGL